jgi:hypothetical protein
MSGLSGAWVAVLDGHLHGEVTRGAGTHLGRKGRGAHNDENPVRKGHVGKHEVLRVENLRGGDNNLP